jgi:hypothetical protein
MTALAKVIHIMGLLGKPEASYGAGATLAGATDGIQMQYPSRYQGAPIEFDYANDGDLGPSVSALGQIANVAPSGFFFKGSIPFYQRTAGIAYSASVFPSLHNIFKACGLDATVVTTPGTEQWTYAPTVAGLTYTSLGAELYARGEKYVGAGVLGNLKFDAPTTKPPIWTMDAMGIATLPTDAAVPAITYPLQTILPLLSGTIALTIGGLSANAEIISHSFDMGRELFPRVNQSGNGTHRGFVPGDRKPTVKVVLEATALVVGAPYTSSTAFDPYRLYDSGQIFSMIIQKGTTQYFREKLNFPQAQVVGYKLVNNNAIPQCELTIQPANSTASSNDDFNFVYD